MKFNEESAEMGRRIRDSVTLAEYLRGHQNFRNLTPDKIDVFRKYIEENPKGKFIKQTKLIGRSFIDKCPEHLLEELVARIYSEFRDYLLNQKRIDDDKLARVRQLDAPEDRHSLWRTGFDQFCTQERERSREARRR